MGVCLQECLINRRDWPLIPLNLRQISLPWNNRGHASSVITCYSPSDSNLRCWHIHRIPLCFSPKKVTFPKKYFYES